MFHYEARASCELNKTPGPDGPTIDSETHKTTTLTADRRRAARLPRSYCASIRDGRGNILARGRTTNISETGLFIVGTGRDGALDREHVVVEIDIPSTKPRRDGRGGLRRVQYVARVVRTQAFGPMFGVGLELLEKLA